jgi:hypothetical protein
VTRKSRTVRIALLAALAAFVLAVVPVATAGKGQPGGPGGGGTATLSASPNPAPAWGAYHLAGCGYVAGKNVNLVIDQPSASAFYAVAPSSSGCIYSTFWAEGAGAYSIKAYQSLKGTKQTLMASTTLSVV